MYSFRFTQLAKHTGLVGVAGAAALAVAGPGAVAHSAGGPAVGRGGSPGAPVQGTPPAPKAEEHAKKAVLAETPPNIPIAGVTPKESPGATTDAAEEPEAGEGGYVKFSQYPHSKNLPQVPCGKAIAPAVPAPNYGRPGWMKAGQKAVVEIKSTARTIQLTPSVRYPAWTFDDVVPGPVLRARVGDWLECRHSNADITGMGHNIDFHAVMGPGGGAPATYADTGEARSGLFKLTYPGLYVYHCAAAPLPAHVGNGMYGIIIVDPADGPLKSPPTMFPRDDLLGLQGGDGWFKGSGSSHQPQATGLTGQSPALPPATMKTPDGRPLREFAIVQSEFYYAEDNASDDDVVALDYKAGLDEIPRSVVFNGREGALTEKPIMVEQGDRVRLYFGNGGPNAISSLHLIGNIFDAVWREGDMMSQPARGVQTTTVPAGGSVVVEWDATVPGTFSLVDHALFRVDKGCVGFFKVLPSKGAKRADLYASGEPPVFCPGCKLHN